MSDAYPCPHCHKRPLEAIATAPYVRGFVLAFQYGTKRFVGCTGCVRAQIYKEVGLSMLIGWFSITALFINPCLILYNSIRGIFVSANPEAVRKVLSEAGLPETPRTIDPLQVAYALAASMIAADGRVEASELALAEAIGKKIFSGFEGEALKRSVAGHRDLPSVTELAGLMAEVMTPQGKLVLYRYLEAIAGADGNVSPEEKKLLSEVQRALGLTDAEIAAGREAA